VLPTAPVVCADCWNTSAFPSLALKLIVNGTAGPECQIADFTVPGVTELPRRYDVTITVDRDGGDHPDPAEFAVAAGQAASARAASIVSAHTASQIISIVTVLAADQPAAVAVALAVVSDAPKRPFASSTR
jgi:hypothetical protein